MEGTAEYGKCLSYYHQQEAVFNAARATCEAEADVTYPRSLYDTGRYSHVSGGFDRFGNFHGNQTIRIEPNYYRNAELDRLRMRVIGPCMQARGWNSASDWRAGRHAASPQKKAPEKLPWQR